MTLLLNWHVVAIRRHPCWFCGKKGLPKDSFFSQEFDTPVHVACLFNQITKSDDESEATLIAEDLIILLQELIKHHRKRRCEERT